MIPVRYSITPCNNSCKYYFDFSNTAKQGTVQYIRYGTVHRPYDMGMYNAVVTNQNAPKQTAENFSAESEKHCFYL